MGVNDLIYRTDGAGAEAALRALIRNARASKPSIRIVLGTVLPTRRAGLDPAFAAEVADLNRRIPVLASTLSTARSPIAVAATATGFVAASDTYDGLHPNARGELKIAAAFADALATRFKLGPVHQRPLPVVPVGPRTPPTLRATGGDGSAVLRWSESPGATAYWLWTRNVTAKSSWQRQPTALTLTRRPWTLRGANGAT